ncbi:von Willebrand domain-containing protein, partial [Xylogone sp. PMI_703]
KELIGYVKPKREAKKEFEKAIKNIQAAALLEEHIPKTLEAAIGNIPANSEVEVHITYVSELRIAMLDQHGAGEDQHSERKDQHAVEKEIDVVIPISIAPRYGWTQGEYTDVGFEMNGLDIIVEINDNGTISNLSSPTHSGVKYKNEQAKTLVVSSHHDLSPSGSELSENPTQRIARYTSSSPILDSDFILTIKTYPEYILRSRAVISPPNEQGHAALMVNIRPSDIFEYDFSHNNFDGEVIIIIDRSDSMGWGYGAGSRSATKIKTLRRALPLAIVNMPSGCAFNFISFGTETEFMWDKSRPYSTDNIRYAKEYINAEVKANMGTTELLFAMKQAVEYRSKERSSTQIIIITDGEVDEINIVNFLLETRKKHGDKIRFFALGIGDSVSHLVNESIGEFGGGYGEVINLVGKPEWEDRFSRMLRFGVTHGSWDIDISLGPSFERRSLLDHRIHGEPWTQQNDVTPYIQAPSFQPFAFRSLFFLLDIGSQTPPEQITLTPKNTGSKYAKSHSLHVE